MSIKLADVSEFQPNVDDALYVAWSHGIAIRALYGSSHVDDAWFGGGRRTALHVAGIEFLPIYQYLVAGQPGKAQAQAFHALVGPIRDGEVFVADFEEGQKSMLTDWYNEMIALYGKGITSYLWTYTGLSFGEAQGVLPVQWIADYTAKEPSSPHILWQFTDAYAVPGVGTCDCNSYDGTMAQLAAHGWNGAPKPTPAPAPGFHVTALPPGQWQGQITLSGTGSSGSATWYTATANGRSWTQPSQAEPTLTGSSSYSVTATPPGWWTGVTVLAGQVNGNRWHTSTNDGASWSTPSQ